MAEGDFFMGGINKKKIKFELLKFLMN